MQTRPPFSHRPLSPLSSQMLKEGMWLTAIQIAIDSSSIIIIGGAAWVVDQNFHHALHITARSLLDTICTTSFLPDLFSCFIWGTSRVLNREKILSELTATQLCLLAIGSALAISTLIAPIVNPITTDSHIMWITVTQSYVKAKSNFPIFTLLQKISYISVGLLSLCVLIGSGCFRIPRLTTLFKTLFQTGYALYRKL